MARLRESLGGTGWAIALLLVSQVTLFASCTTTSTTKPMLLRHPGTGHTVECYPSVQDCQAEYQLQGYVSLHR